ncbi:N-acyl amino acid synthase FeeM domain-containing protein [Paenibacillus sp. strain BS8-2]
MKNDSSYSFRVAQGELRKQAITLHVERYLEVGFFRNEEVDPYQDNAVYFTAASKETDDVVGVTRLIFEKLEKLPTVANFNIYDLEKARLQALDSHRYAELSAFTKLPAHDVALGLIKTVFQYSEQVGITHWICCVDERVYNYMNRVFRFPFRMIGEPKVYLGSNSIPCVLILSDILETIKAERAPLYEYFIERQTRYLEVIQ